MSAAKKTKATVEPHYVAPKPGPFGIAVEVLRLHGHDKVAQAIMEQGCAEDVLRDLLLGALKRAVADLKLFSGDEEFHARLAAAVAVIAKAEGRS